MGGECEANFTETVEETLTNREFQLLFGTSHDQRCQFVLAKVVM